MLPFEDRYSRQRRLPEVGYRGQIALEQARPTLPVHAGLGIETEYLNRSGLESWTVDTTALPRSFVHAPRFEFTGPLQVAQGAWSALELIRRSLDMPSESQSNCPPLNAKEEP